MTLKLDSDLVFEAQGFYYYCFIIIAFSLKCRFFFLLLVMCGLGSCRFAS